MLSLWGGVARESERWGGRWLRLDVFLFLAAADLLLFTLAVKGASQGNSFGVAEAADAGASCHLADGEFCPSPGEGEAPPDFPSWYFLSCGCGFVLSLLVLLAILDALQAVASPVFAGRFACPCSPSQKSLEGAAVEAEIRAVEGKVRQLQAEQRQLCAVDSFAAFALLERRVKALQAEKEKLVKQREDPHERRRGFGVAAAWGGSGADSSSAFFAQWLRAVAINVLGTFAKVREKALREAALFLWEEMQKRFRRGMCVAQPVACWAVLVALYPSTRSAIPDGFFRPFSGE